MPQVAKKKGSIRIDLTNIFKTARHVEQNKESKRPVTSSIGNDQSQRA